MSIPNSREDLKNWCLRKLGADVLEINISEDQVEDRIDEGLIYFKNYHFDAIEVCYFTHQLTASSMKLTAAATGEWTKNDILEGSTSNATAFFHSLSEDLTTIYFKTKTGTFLANEVVTNQNTSVTVITANIADAIVIGDVDNKYVPIPDRILSVTDVLIEKSNLTYASQAGGNIFDYQYQWAINNMYNVSSADIASYQIYKQYIAMWRDMFIVKKGVRFNRLTNKLFLDVQDYNQIGDYVVIQAYAFVDPEEHTRIYADEFVREYCTALIKQQWGTNLKKFNGIKLPGDVTLNGQGIYDEATVELAKLVERVKKEFQLPPGFICA